MARLVPTTWMLALSTVTGASLADAADNPWSPAANIEKATPSHSFKIVGDQPVKRADRWAGARFIAGRQLTPNATIGIGFFGHKWTDPALAPVAPRDLPKRRKPAVGFSLRF